MCGFSAACGCQVAAFLERPSSWKRSATMAMQSGAGGLSHETGPSDPASEEDPGSEEESEVDPLSVTIGCETSAGKARMGLSTGPDSLPCLFSEGSLRSGRLGGMHRQPFPPRISIERLLLELSHLGSWSSTLEVSDSLSMQRGL